MKNLVGNSEVKKALLSLYERRRIPNAMLFAGPDGVGKKQFALELARMFVCLSPAVHGACGDCAACKRVGVFALPTSDTKEDYKKVYFSEHPDVGMVIPFKRNLLVDAIRDLEREAHFRPYEASARIFIVDNADKMNDAASNALLKTLEEPPATSHIILIAARADSLLPTIRSRTQIMRFAPVAYQEIERLLLADGHFSPDDAALAARVSDGSVARALDIVPASFRTQRSAMLGVLNAAAVRDRRSLLAAAEEMNDAKNKEEFEAKLEILRGLIHDVWLLKNGGDPRDLLNFDLVAELQELATRLESSCLASWLGDIETMYENFVVNINRKVATDALFVGMAAA
ncbi:MAG TPA: DNA polymerase III subunit delta' [Pyrinomonadaceae bacterium]